jgi:hypothetical protein
VLAGVADDELELLQRAGTLDVIARGTCYLTVRDAVAAAQELAMPSSGAEAAADAA